MKTPFRHLRRAVCTLSILSVGLLALPQDADANRYRDSFKKDRFSRGSAHFRTTHSSYRGVANSRQRTSYRHRPSYRPRTSFIISAGTGNYGRPFGGAYYGLSYSPSYYGGPFGSSYFGRSYSPRYYGRSYSPSYYQRPVYYRSSSPFFFLSSSYSSRGGSMWGRR